jgi:hypothetical protein
VTAIGLQISIISVNTQWMPGGPGREKPFYQHMMRALVDAYAEKLEGITELLISLRSPAPSSLPFAQKVLRTVQSPAWRPWTRPAPQP